MVFTIQCNLNGTWDRNFNKIKIQSLRTKEELIILVQTMLKVGWLGWEMVSDLNHFSFKDWTKLKIPSEINPSLISAIVIYQGKIGFLNSLFS